MKETRYTYYPVFSCSDTIPMTENSDIPSAHHRREHLLKDNTTTIFAILVVIGVFFLSFLSVRAADSENKNLSSALSHTNVQTIRLLEPTTFKNSLAYGGAIYSTTDNALVGHRSVIDSIDGEYVAPTGHTTNIYIVRQGDTISEIAESFGVSANTIRWANNLGKSSLKVGQKLTILPVSGVIHTIKKGDTISKIAKTYDAVVDDIVAYNRIDENALIAGDDITIPGGLIKTVAKPPVITTAPKASGTVTVSGGKLNTVRSPSGLLEVTTGITYSWKNGVKTSRLRGTGGPSYSNYYLRPINGWGKSRGLHGFNSVDFAAPKGTPILASASGKVIISKKSGWNGGYGKYVAIEHSNGTQTLYAHQSSVIVSKGQNVVQGQVIGYVGTTGNSSGNHLHFEVRGAKNPF